MENDAKAAKKKVVKRPAKVKIFRLTVYQDGSIAVSLKDGRFRGIYDQGIMVLKSGRDMTIIRNLDEFVTAQLSN